MRSVLLFLLTCAAALAGCDRTPAGSSQEARTTFTIAVAASLKPAIDELVADYELANPAVKINVTYGASGTLFAQIKNDAPFDLFLSADLQYPRAIVEAGLSDASDLFVFAQGTLVVWMSDSLSADIAAANLGVLRDASVRRIAIANSRLAPYGRAAEQAIERAGLRDIVAAKLVYGENVAQAAHFAEMGAADAALLPYSLIRGMSAPGQGRYRAVPEELYDPIEHAGVVISKSSQREAAIAFRDYIFGETGQYLLRARGLSLPTVAKLKE